jgi:hypothetical protein
MSILATALDYKKIQYLRRCFEETIKSLDVGKFPDDAREEVRPILTAASVACIYNNEWEPEVRKYYAFTGNFTRVWFTFDLLTIMPDNLRSKRNRREARFLVKEIAGLLVGEVRKSLRAELGI